MDPILQEDHDEKNSTLESNTNTDHGQLALEEDTSNGSKPKTADEASPPPPPEGTVAWLQVLGAFCLNLNTWGLMSAYGVYQTHYELHLLADRSSSSIAWIGSIQGFLMFLFSCIIGPIFDSGYLHTLLWTGSVFSVVGFFMLSLCHTYWQCFLAQGIAMGIGFGCLYLPAPALVSMHFHRRRALAFGISSVGSSIGGVVFPLVFTELEPRIGFGWATRVLAFILLLTTVIPLVTMRFPQTSTLAPSPSAKGLALSLSLTSWIDTAALSSAPYLLLNAGLMTGYMGLYIVLYYISLLTDARTTTAASLSPHILSILNAATIVGRIAPSAAADRVGPVHVLGASAVGSLVLVAAVLAVHNAAGIVMWALVFGVVSGAFMALPAAGVVSVSRDGGSRIGTRLGMTLGLVGCGVLVGGPIAGALLARGGWAGLVGWSSGLLAASACALGGARVATVGWRIKEAV